MVLKIDAPLWNDISDRATRELGVVSNDELSELLPYPRAWWVRPNKGRISYIDDFEDTLNWEQLTGTVTKASDATFVHGGASAMKLVTGAVAGNEADGKVFLPALAEDSTYATLGVWLTLNGSDIDKPRDAIIRWYVTDRTLDAIYTFMLRFWQHETTPRLKLQYMDSEDTWADATGGAGIIGITWPQFNYYEIAIRRVVGDAWKYEHVRMNDRVFSLAGVGAAVDAFVHEGQIVELACTTDAAEATTMYADDFAIVDLLDEL